MRPVWLAGTLCVACDGLQSTREGMVGRTPPEARRPGMLDLRASDPDSEHWRMTQAGPAVYWRLPAAGGDRILPTNADVTVRASGSWARLGGADGRAWTFGPLVARDGRGRPVEAVFASGEHGLSVRVPAGTGPIYVDPVLRTAPFSASFAADAVAGVGDLNGDGFADIAAGAVGGTTITPGQVQVWPGATAGPDPAVTLDPTPSSAAWQYGRALAGSGDLDGDGYADLVVGGDHRAWVHYGAASGLSTRTTRIEAPSGRVGEFGFAVAIAPDLDGDGVDDLLVGDPGYDSSRGRVSLFPGSAGVGVSTTAAMELEGQTAGEWFGVAVDGVGDVDADGYNDVVIGAHAWNGITGRAYIFVGAASGLATMPATTLSGVDPLDNFGRAVDGAGDVDQDGYADVVVGAFNGASAFGQGSVFHGSASGLSATATTVVRGPAYGAKFANAVAGLGDVDGDGYPDVGMAGHGTTTQAGVHHGSATGAGTTPIPRLTGGVTFGKLLDGAGDADGDGYADLLVADPGAGTVDLHFGGPDLDGDGWILPEDCDDQDSGVRGGAVVWTDADGDGFGDPLTEVVSCMPGPEQVSNGADCDDSSAEVHPDAMEWVGDRVDSDCDGIELCFVDGDGDGVLSDAAETISVVVSEAGLACSDHGHHGEDAVWGDCDDADSAAFPGAAEVCSLTDNDCDGGVDTPVPSDAPQWRRDGDGDGFGAGEPVQACAEPSGWVAASDSIDCDDTRSDVNPSAVEVPGDGLDSDCDGLDPGSGTETGPQEGLDGADGESDPSESAKGGCQTLPLGMWAGWVGLLPALAWRRSGGAQR